MENTLTILELRAQIARACNAAASAGVPPVMIAMTLGSVSADLNLQGAYNALAEYENEIRKKQEENADV